MREFEKKKAIWKAEQFGVTSVAPNTHRECKSYLNRYMANLQSRSSLFNWLRRGV